MAARRRGRKRQPNAKRRTTTREGRRTGLDPVDHGTPLLLARKMTVSGRVDLPIEPASVLLARELIDRREFDALGEVADLLRRVARAWGGKDGSCAGLWQALLSAATSTVNPAIPVPPGSDAARRRLERLLGKLDGSSALVLALAENRTVPIVVRAWERRLTPADTIRLERLRRALARLPAPAPER